MKKEVRERRPCLGRRPRGRGRGTIGALLSTVTASALATVLVAAGARAQGAPPSMGKTEVVVLQGGTIHVGNGDVIENGAVILKGSRIEAVGKGLAVPEGAKVVDLAGRHVYPGLIDAESGVLLDPEASASGDGQPALSAVDAIDPFQTNAREEAWAGGVTSIYVASHRALFDGAGAVLKLRSGRRAADLVLKKDAAVAATFGLNGSRPSVRLREWKTFQERLAATKKYIEAWDDYAEKLAEYTKELEKQKKDGNTKLDKKDEAPKPPTPPGGEPHPEARPNEGEGPGGPGGPNPRRPRRRPPQDAVLQWLLHGTAGDAPLHVTDRDDPNADPNADPHEDGKAPEKLSWKDGVSYAEDPPKDGAGGEKKEDAKKPQRPGRDPQTEVLRKLLEGKLTLRVQASQAADLQNLLDLRRQFPLDLVLTGGADAWKFAPALADAGIPVVYALAADADAETAAVPAKLAAAHVDFALTANDPGAASTRFLALVAAAAVAGGLDREQALTAISLSPARLLGVAEQVGSLEAGKDADLIVTRGELFSSSMVVERVFVDGRPVLSR